MKKNLINLKRIAYILPILPILISDITILPVYATNKQYENSQGIEFYNADACSVLDTGSITKTTGSVSDNEASVVRHLTTKNFSGNNKAPLNAVQIAAILGNLQQESGFDPKANNQDLYRGIAQWNSGRWDGIKEPRDDLENQLDYMQQEMDGGYKKDLSDFWESNSVSDIEKATYAVTRNYEVAIKSDSASKSWSSDEQASQDVQGWSKRLEYAKKAYIKYANQVTGSYSSGTECGGLLSGGMNLDEANSFMEEYKSLEPKNWEENTLGTEYDINGTTCKESSLANCVAFSQYFINRYTSKKAYHLGNGNMVVGDLLDLGFEDGGTTPKVYSIFSANKYTEYGHTGVVLGIDKEAGKIIIGEAGCGEGLDWIKAREYNLEEFSSGDYTYAYTDNFLEGGL